MDQNTTEQEDDHSDRITKDMLSESAYRRLRAERFAQFSSPLQRKLAWQTAMIAALMLLIPLYELFPTASEVVPLGDASTASPKILLLGIVGLGIELATGTVLVAVGLYRLRAAPVDEDTATTLLNLEDTAATIGLYTGGMAIALTLAGFLLGALGPDVIAGYVSLLDANPYVDSGTGISVAEFAVGALSASALLWTARQYLVFELWKLDRTG